MTTLEKAARQAIEDFDSIVFHSERRIPDKSIEVIAYSAIAKLRQALEQPKQEPVTWMYSDAKGNNPVPLYTEPPKREWVGLTDGEMTQVANTAETYTESVKLTEAALKELNT